MPATAAQKPPGDTPAMAPKPSPAPPPAAMKPVPDAHAATPGAPADDSKAGKRGPKAESQTPPAA